MERVAALIGERWRRVARTAAKDYDEPTLRRAIEAAEARSARTWSYVERCLTDAYGIAQDAAQPAAVSHDQWSAEAASDPGDTPPQAFDGLPADDDLPSPDELPVSPEDAAACERFVALYLSRIPEVDADEVRELASHYSAAVLMEAIGGIERKWFANEGELKRFLYSRPTRERLALAAAGASGPSPDFDDDIPY